MSAAKSEFVVIWVTDERGHGIMFSELKPRHAADPTDMAHVGELVSACVRAALDLAKVDGWAARLSPATRAAVAKTEPWAVEEIERALVKSGLSVDW